MRRLASVSLVLSVAAGFLAMAVPAEAAAVGTVTVTYNPGAFNYTVAPNSLTGSVGDTFTLADTMISGNSNPAVYVSLQDESGAVSLGATSCAAATDCPVLDLFSGGATGVFTIDAPGTVKVMRANFGAPSQIGTLTITAGGGGGGGGGSAPASTYTFRYLRPDGTECAAISPQKVQSGWVALPGKDVDCTVNGAAIVGWKAKGSDRLLTPDMQVDATADQTFTAVLNDPNVWLELDANVALDDPCMNGANKNVASATDRVTAAYRKKTQVLLPRAAVCAPPNATLIGWNTSADGQGKTFRPYSVVSPTDLVGVNVLYLYAMWQPAEGSPVTITWRPAGGTCTLKSTKVAFGSAFAQPSDQVCTREGYELAGWNKKADGSGAWLEGKPVTRDTVAYAKWIQIVNVPVTWGVPGCPDTFVSGTAIYDLPSSHACDTDLTLASFNSAADGSGASYAVGTHAALSSTRHLYAQWTVPITYDANGGTCTTTGPAPALNSEFAVPQETACAKPGYALAGWTLPAAAAGSQPTLVPLTAVHKATEPRTYTAIWTAPVTLTFDGNGGDCAVTQRTIGAFGSFTLPGPDACTRDGFDLAAWSIKGTELTFPVPSDSYVVLVPAAFVAKWVPKVTVSFASNGPDCEIPSLQVGPGRELVVPGAGQCQREGFTFKGWDVLSGAQADQPTFYAPSATYTVHATSVLRARWSGKPSCSTPAGPGVDWQGCDKHGVVLVGVDLQGANLDGTNFRGAYLDGANLTGSSTEGIDLSDAKLRGTNLSGLDLDAKSAKLASADFTDYELASCQIDCFAGRIMDRLEVVKAANLTGARLAGQNLSEAVLVGVNLTSADLTGTDLSNTRLWFADLTGAKTKGLDLTGADMRLGRFHSLDLRAGRVTLTGAVMSWHGGIPPYMPSSPASFVGSNLAGQDLRGRDLSEVNFSQSNLIGADLRGSTILITFLSGADLRMAQLSAGSIVWSADGTNFSGVNLSGALLSGATGANFTGAMLSSATLIGDFSGANFAGADLTNAQFKLANLKGAFFAAANLKGAAFQLTNEPKDTPALPGIKDITYVGAR